MALSMIFSSIGGKILGGFEKDPEKKAAAQEQGMHSINNWFASKNKRSADRSEQDEEQKAEEQKSKEKEIIESVWTSVGTDEELNTVYNNKLLFKRSIMKNHIDLIRDSIKDNESNDDIKTAVLQALRSDIQAKALERQNNGAQPQQV